MFYIFARKAIGDIGDLRKYYAHARYASIRYSHTFAVHVFNMSAEFVEFV